MKTRELERDRADFADMPLQAEAAPGRATRTAGMVGPNGVLASGLLRRKARDGNGVAAGADAAVAAAASSSGAALPGALMRKFEASLGADLSGVRVHTGAASAQAADAVGARAYALGSDVHFGAGQYDPSSGAGELLLAHEVAHTVQQRQGVPRYKLAVSGPGDACELEADQAASAMVGGAPFAIAGSSPAVSRAPSYASGDASKIADTSPGNGEQQRDEMESEVAKLRTSAMAKAGTLLGKVVGYRTDPMTIGNGLQRLAHGRYDSVIAMIEGELDNRAHGSNGELTIMVPLPGGGGREVTDTHALESTLNELKGQTSTFAAVSAAIAAVGSANAAASKLMGGAGALNGKLAAIDPKHFKTAKDASAKITTVLSAIDAVNQMADQTALRDFEAAPDLDTASTWAKHVGDIFTSLAPIGGYMDDVVPGSGAVISGLFQTPATVFDQFEAILTERYTKIDNATRICGQPKLGKSGEAGNSEICPAK